MLVQWLYAVIARDQCSVPGQGAKIPQIKQLSQKINKTKRLKKKKKKKTTPDFKSRSSISRTYNCFYRLRMGNQENHALLTGLDLSLKSQWSLLILPPWHSLMIWSSSRFSSWSSLLQHGEIQNTIKENRKWLKTLSLRKNPTFFSSFLRHIWYLKIGTMACTKMKTRVKVWDK